MDTRIEQAQGDLRQCVNHVLSAAAILGRVGTEIGLDNQGLVAFLMQLKQWVELDIQALGDERLPLTDPPPKPSTSAPTDGDYATQEGCWWHEDPFTRRRTGVVWTRGGMAFVVAYRGSMITEVSTVKNGRTYVRTYPKYYSEKYATTLAKRFITEQEKQDG